MERSRTCHFANIETPETSGNCCWRTSYGVSGFFFAHRVVLANYSAEMSCFLYRYDYIWCIKYNRKLLCKSTSMAVGIFCAHFLCHVAEKFWGPGSLSEFCRQITDGMRQMPSYSRASHRVFFLWAAVHIFQWRSCAFFSVRILLGRFHARRRGAVFRGGAHAIVRHTAYDGRGNFFAGGRVGLEVQPSPGQ